MILTRTGRCKQVTHSADVFAAKIVEIFVIDSSRDFTQESWRYLIPKECEETTICNIEKNYPEDDAKHSFVAVFTVLWLGLLSDKTSRADGATTQMTSANSAKYLDGLNGARFINRLAAPLAINRLIQMLDSQ